MFRNSVFGNNAEKDGLNMVHGREAILRRLKNSKGCAKKYL